MVANGHNRRTRSKGKRGKKKSKAAVAKKDKDVYGDTGETSEEDPLFGGGNSLMQKSSSRNKRR